MFGRMDLSGSRSPQSHRVVIVPNGPYEVEPVDGVEVLFARSRRDYERGEVESHDGRARLCRCGQSERKPACDGSCDEVGFRAVSSTRPPDTSHEPGAVARLAFVLDGPLMVAGVDIHHEDGRVTCLANREASLCRCGGSRNKPWCDFSHRAVDFRG